MFCVFLLLFIESVKLSHNANTNIKTIRQKAKKMQKKLQNQQTKCMPNGILNSAF